MSKCLYCHERKGKRSCPALSGLICTSCCGTHRMVKITCPAFCMYLDSNLEYQQKRVADHFEHGRTDLYKELLEFGGEKAAEVFYLLEAVTFKHFHTRRDGQDGEVVTAVQTLRRTFSPIHIPETAFPAFTEKKKKEFQAYLEGQKVDPQLISEVLDRALTFINLFSGSGLHSNRFLQGLMGYMKSRHPEVADQLANLGTTGGGVILPSGAQWEGQNVPFHTH